MENIPRALNGRKFSHHPRLIFLFSSMSVYVLYEFWTIFPMKGLIRTKWGILNFFCYINCRSIIKCGSETPIYFNSTHTHNQNIKKSINISRFNWNILNFIFFSLKFSFLNQNRNFSNERTETLHLGHVCVMFAVPSVSYSRIGETVDAARWSRFVSPRALCGRTVGTERAKRVSSAESTETPKERTIKTIAVCSPRRQNERQTNIFACEKIATQLRSKRCSLCQWDTSTCS